MVGTGRLAATLNLNGFGVTIAGLNTNAAVGTPVVQDNSGTSVALTITNAVASSYAGTIQNGPLAGVLTLAKNGAGALTFSGTIIHTGNSTFNAGTTTFTSASSFVTRIVNGCGNGTIVNARRLYQ